MASPQTFSRTQIYLHWSIVVLVAFQIFSGDAITQLWADRMDAIIPNEPSANPHAFVGLLIFALMIWRVIVRLRHGAPPAPQSERPALVMASKISHGLFYLILIAMPISGSAAWFFGLEQPANLHALTRLVLIPLIGIHALAALAHHFWFKTNVLKRMLGIG